MILVYQYSVSGMIIQQTSSGKGILLTDDFGNRYLCALAGFDMLRQGRIKFVTMQRLPNPAYPGRYNKSPISHKNPDGTYSEIQEGEDGWFEPQCGHNVIVEHAKDDGSGHVFKASQKRKEAFRDKKVAW